MTAQAPVSLMVEGYRRAYERLMEAVSNAEATAEQTFIPLFEALNWAASIDLYFVENGDPIEDDLLTGVRFARNRVHHQWANALNRGESAGMPSVMRATSSSRMVVPPPGFWWYWVKADQLPARHPRRVDAPSGEKQYECKLAGQSAEETLKALLPVLDSQI